MTTLWTTIAACLVCAAVGGLMAWSWLPPRKRVPRLPSAWALSPRPVFNVTERRVYRKLQDAFPKHVVLPKLPLVRFCQPDVLTQVHYWHNLLGSTHVSFAVCSANGKVLLAVELESSRSRSRRSTQIKDAVLAACGVKCIRLAADQLPSTAELHALVPLNVISVNAAEPVQGAAMASMASARDSLATAVATRRAERSGKGQESSLFLDSFFTPDSRMDAFSDADPRYARTAVGTKTSMSGDTDFMRDLDELAVDLEQEDLESAERTSDWPVVPGSGGVVIDDVADALRATTPRH